MAAASTTKETTRTLEAIQIKMDQFYIELRASLAILHEQEVAAHESWMRQLENGFVPFLPGYQRQL